MNLILLILSLYLNLINFDLAIFNFALFIYFNLTI